MPIAQGRVILFTTHYTSGSYFMEVCWGFSNLNIGDTLTSENPIINALAMIDKRLGKRRLKKINITGLHPLALILLNLRLDCEKLKDYSSS